LIKIITPATNCGFIENRIAKKRQNNIPSRYVFKILKPISSGEEIGMAGFAYPDSNGEMFIDGQWKRVILGGLIFFIVFVFKRLLGFV
jgi:hypothetical protein